MGVCPCAVCVPDDGVKDCSGEMMLGPAAWEVLMEGNMLCVACPRRVQGVELSRLQGPGCETYHKRGSAACAGSSGTTLDGLPKMANRLVTARS